MSLLQKSLFVIPEVFIGNPVSFKNKDFWIPAYAGMTVKVIFQRLMQEALMYENIILLFKGLFTTANGGSLSIS